MNASFGCPNLVRTLSKNPLNPRREAAAATSEADRPGRAAPPRKFWSMMLRGLSGWKPGSPRSTWT
eukprot:6000032-Lingulodinium_polyedra.AAC.1